jgi:molybdopterin-guanine dinucleotide biosynthesis protein A
MEKMSVVIQAGGESRRMGSDKGLVLFLGQPLIRRVAQRLRPIAAEMLVTTNLPQEYTFLDLPLYEDVLPGAGALGGLLTALQAASQPLVAIVACDMPFANPGLLLAERDWLLSGGYDLVVPRNQNGREPFHAVYRREACLPHIQAALQAGKRRVDAWFEMVKLGEFPQEEILKFDPHQLAFLNVNTPEELALAEKLEQNFK